MRLLLLILSLLLIVGLVRAQSKPRARDVGIPFDGTPGPLNAITDVKGVEVGHSTIIRGGGKLKVGQGPVRTGVTAVLPRGQKSANDSVFAAATMADAVVRLRLPSLEVVATVPISGEPDGLGHTTLLPKFECHACEAPATQ